MEDLFEMDEETSIFFEELGRAIADEESEPQLLNIPRLVQMAHAYKQLQNIASGTWKISSSAHTSFTSISIKSSLPHLFLGIEFKISVLIVFDN